MTNVEFLNAVVSAAISEDVTAYAVAALAKVDGKNAARRAKASAKASAAASALLADLFAAHEGDVFTAASAASALGVTVQKSSALLRSAVASGHLVEVAPVKGKSGKVKAYVRPSSEDGDGSAD